MILNVLHVPFSFVDWFTTIVFMEFFSSSIIWLQVTLCLTLISSLCILIFDHKILSFPLALFDSFLCAEIQLDLLTYLLPNLPHVFAFKMLERSTKKLCSMFVHLSWVNFPLPLPLVWVALLDLVRPHLHLHNKSDKVASGKLLHHCRLPLAEWNCFLVDLHKVAHSST